MEVRGVLHLRKRVAQIGVVIFTGSLLAPVILAPLAALGVGSGLLIVGYFPFLILAGPVLLLASLIPGPKDESWGSIWPLAGYDNAIDGLYVRGPWWQRFYELDEQDAERRVTIAMGEWF